jgi:hypothetical protein
LLLAYQSKELYLGISKGTIVCIQMERQSTYNLLLKFSIVIMMVLIHFRQCNYIGSMMVHLWGRILRGCNSLREVGGCFEEAHNA